MIARELETIIESKISKFGISNQSHGHVTQRFESLRSFGLLPKGRVRNSQHLTYAQIVSGILSIISSEVGYAGHTALILKKLKPVGGAKASFHGEEIFCKALEILLKNEKDILESLVKVTVSDSEIYTNSHCRTAIHYLSDDQEKIAYYVDSHACSLLREGAEKNYKPSEIISSVINEIVFYPSFFRSIEKRLKYEASMPPAEYPDEPETDEELEKQQRKEYLGITRNSYFLNMAVDCQVTWPKHETVVEFEGYKLVLMPKTRENTTSIHIDLYENKVTNEQAISIINRFLSILTWCDNQYAVLQDGWSGNPIPVPVSKRNLAFCTAYHWGFFHKKLENPDIRKAIAIYREGRNAEQNFLVSYAVLSYYKVIEIWHKKDKKKWFEDNYPIIRDNLDKRIIKTFEEHCGNKRVKNYITDTCRHAVAHAGDPHNIDPDDYEKLKKLHVAAHVLRELARHFIRTEMELSEHYL